MVSRFFFCEARGWACMLPLRHCYRSRYITWWIDTPTEWRAGTRRVKAFRCFGRWAPASAPRILHIISNHHVPAMAMSTSEGNASVLCIIPTAYMTRREWAVASGTEFRYCHFIVFIVLASPCPRPYPYRSSGYRWQAKHKHTVTYSLAKIKEIFPPRSRMSSHKGNTPRGAI